MQTRPTNWAAVFAAPHITEYKYVINGVDYLATDVQGTPTLTKPLMQEPCIGRCCTGSMDITIRQHAGETIPKAASVKAYCRLKTRTGEITTSWVDKGHYWISRRSGTGGLVTLTCRDGMMLAGQTYLDKTRFIEWPVAMTDVFEEIASLMGVSIDERTQIRTGAMYTVDYPNEDVLMSEILANIAAAHGGNFVMSDSGKLWLIPYPDTVNPVQVIGDSYSRYTPLSIGLKKVSRVTLTDSADNQFTSGDDTGVELVAGCEYATQAIVNGLTQGYALENGILSIPNGVFTNGILFVSDGSHVQNNQIFFSDGASLVGRSFNPYELAGAYLDPLVELGDTVSINRKGTEIHIIIGTMRVRCNPSYVCDFQNGVEDDDEDEVPYVSAAELRAKRYLTTTKSYFGNRINRTEGFVSELMENDEPIARMVANANRFSMQRKVDGAWEDCLYFDPVARTYKFKGDVEISTLTEVSVASLTNTSLVFAADASGNTFARSYVSNVFAYTGSEKALPVVSGVTGAVDGMTVSVGETVDQQIPITISVLSGVNLGSTESTSGTLVVHVTSPVPIDLEINWCKVNTGVAGADGKDGTNGQDGAPGKDGEPGKDGQDGVTYYTWVKYADSPTTGMSDSPEGKKYIGIAYNKETTEKSTNYADYEWSLIKGADGTNGYNNTVIQLYQRANSIKDNGTLLVASGQLNQGTLTIPTIAAELENGVLSVAGLSAPVEDITFTFSSNTLSGDLGVWSRWIPSGRMACYTTMAAVSSIYDVVTIPASAWSEAVLLVENGADGLNGTNGQDGQDGQDAITQYTWIKYADTPTSGMSDTPEGKKYMGIAYNKPVALESTDYGDYAWSLIQGADGINGTNGADGTTYYTWVKYADDVNGAGMSDDPTGKYYIGLAYNKTTPTESSTATDYQWSLFRGADGVDGADGKDGVNGQDGKDGVTYYTWIKYADTPTSGMSDTPEGKKYMGIAYNKTVSAESSSYSDYAWSLIKGTDGINGTNGTDGTTYYTWVKYADDANGTGMSDNPTGKYYIGLAYNKTTSTESTSASDYQWSLFRGSDGVDGQDGADGKDGTTYYTWVKYADTPTSGMSDNPEGKKYMGLAYNKTTRTESTSYSDYAWSLIQGADGSDGVNGVDGADGTTYYTWVKYADSATGAGMSDNPTNKSYIGLAYNKATPTESTNASDYTWSLFRGADGVDGKDGENGQDGADGTDGFNTAFIYLYKRAETAPAAPTSTTTFTFVTSTLTGTLNGWTQGIPSTDGNPCWVTTAQVAARTATASVPASAWSNPTKLVEDGEGGASTYCQPEAPANGKAQDLWIDSDDNYKLYRHDGTDWVSVQDLNIPDIIRQLAAAQTSLKVLSESIEAKAEATYVTNQIDSLVETFNSALTLKADELTASFEGTAQNAAGEVDQKFSTLIRASGDGVEIGKSDSDFRVLLSNNRLSFRQIVDNTAVEVAYMSDRKLFITDAQITNELAFGANGGNRFVWTKTSNGLSLRYISAAGAVVVTE